MDPAALPGRLADFFTLAEAERESRTLSESDRSPLARELALIAQKREAAETLWPRGCMAEALKLAKSALDEASATLEAFGGRVSSAPAWLAPARAGVAAAVAKTSGARFPELEGDVGPENEDTFRVLVEALSALEDVTRLPMAPPAEIVRLRRSRVAGGAVAGVAFLALLVWFFHTPAFSQVTSSGQFDAAHSAERLIDGDPGTLWLLPDHQPGWAELTLGKPRSVHALRIATGNPPYNNDRAAKEIHVEAFLGGASVKSVDMTLPDPPPGALGWTDVVLDAPKVDRVRIDVRSVRGTGSSIAEVELK